MMRNKFKTIAATLALAACGWACRAGADALDRAIPAPAVDVPAAEASGLQTAVLAGGCFWGLQGMFEHVQGVTRVVAGYSGEDHPEGSSF
jgi:peptide-methionine (S)-S-oxide reductase